MTIDIIIPAGNNVIFYADLLKKSLLHFASGEHKLNFKAIASHNDADKLDGWSVVDRRKAKLLYQTAYGHGETLNLIFDHISSDYTLICDADIVIRKQQWDSMLIDSINSDDRNACAGIVTSCIPSKDGYKRKSTTRYKNFPLVIFSMFRSSFLLEARPDFRPDPVPKDVAWKTISKEESEKWGMKEGTKFKCDTGFRLPYEVHSRGLKSVGIIHEESLKVEPLSRVFETWYFDNQPFVSHAGCSRASTEEERHAWLEFCNDLLKEQSITQDSTDS